MTRKWHAQKTFKISRGWFFEPCWKLEHLQLSSIHVTPCHECCAPFDPLQHCGSPSGLHWNPRNWRKSQKDHLAKRSLKTINLTFKTVRGLFSASYLKWLQNKSTWNMLVYLYYIWIYILYYIYMIYICIIFVFETTHHRCSSRCKHHVQIAQALTDTVRCFTFQCLHDGGPGAMGILRGSEWSHEDGFFNFFKQTRIASLFCQSCLAIG